MWEEITAMNLRILCYGIIIGMMIEYILPSRRTRRRLRADDI